MTISFTQLRIDGSLPGLEEGSGGTLKVKPATGISISASGVGIDSASALTFGANSVWTFPNGVTGKGLSVTGTPVDANHAVNKTYVDSLVTGLQWRQPVEVPGLVGNATVTVLNGLTPAAGDAYVATAAGTPTAGTSDTLAIGDIAEFDGTSWKKIVAGAGGFVAAGTRVILSTTTALITPYTAAQDEGMIVSFTGATNTGGDTGDSLDGSAVIVKGDASYSANAGLVFDGVVPTGSWIQFSGAGQINAGAGLTKSGNTINVVATDSTLTVAADSVGVNLDTARAITLGASGVGVNVEAASAGAGGLSIVGNAVRVAVDTTGAANQASVVRLTANGVSIGVDDTTIQSDGAGVTAVLRIKDLGVTTAKLADNAATLAKINVTFHEEDFAASSFALSSGEYVVTLAAAPLTGAQSDWFCECYRNGLADMTNTGSGTAAASGTEFRVVNTTGTGTLRIGADITATGHLFRVRYLSATV